MGGQAAKRVGLEAVPVAGIASDRVAFSQLHRWRLSAVTFRPFLLFTPSPTGPT